MSFVDYRKYFSEMRGGAYRGIKILSAPVKPRVDVRLSEDNHRDINELIDKTDKLNHSSLALFGKKDNRKARLINHIAYETKRPVCFISCDEFVSHYIGETEKNLSGLFARAESESWIFFLHLADTLFADKEYDTRHPESLTNDSDVGGTSENRAAHEAEHNYLLSRISQYPSAVLLSFNDDAGMQRIKHRVDYVIAT